MLKEYGGRIMDNRPRFEFKEFVGRGTKESGGRL